MMIPELFLLLLCFGLSAFNALSRSALTELTPQFLDAFEAIKPERAGFLIKLRSTNADQARISLLIMDALILIVIGALTISSSNLMYPESWTQIPSLAISLLLIIVIKTLTSAIGERYAETNLIYCLLSSTALNCVLPIVCTIGSFGSIHQSTDD
jgi:CBS domain containing-hemolysin-like protein